MSATLTRDPLLGQRAAPASGQATDLGLYGSAPTAFAIPLAGPPLGSVNTAADEHGTVAAAPLNEPPPNQLFSSATPGLFASAAPALQAADSTASTSLAVSLRPLDHGDAARQISEPATAPDTGAGSVAPVAPVNVLEQTASPSPEIAPLVAQVQAQAAQLEQSLAALTQQLQDSATTAAVPLAAVGQIAADLDTVAGALAESAAQTIADAGETATALLGDLTTSAASAVSEVTGEVGTLLGEVAESAEGLVISATGAADELAGNLGTAAETAIDQASVVVSNLTESVSETVSQGVGTVAETLEAAVEGITDLAGTDPAGGVTTLVGLVSAADMFALNDDGPSLPVLPVASDALGMADLLSDVAPIEPLLGVMDHDDGLLGGIVDDNPLGLGL